MVVHLIGHEHVQLSGPLLQHADALLQAAQAGQAAFSSQLQEQCLNLQDSNILSQKLVQTAVQLLRQSQSFSLPASHTAAAEHKRKV